MKIEIDIKRCTLTILQQDLIRFHSIELENGVTIQSCSYPDCAFRNDDTLRLLYLRGDMLSRNNLPIQLKNISNLLLAYESIKELCKLKNWPFETNNDFKRIKLI